MVVTGGDDGGLGILLLANSRFDLELKDDVDDGIDEPTKGEQEQEVLLIPAAHAAAITAVIYLRSSPPSSSFSSSPYHFFATISTDQRVKIWRIRVQRRNSSTPPADGDNKNNAKNAVIDIEVDKVKEMDSLICDASAAAVVHYTPQQKQGDDGDDGDGKNGEERQQRQLGEEEAEKEENYMLVVTGIGVEFLSFLC